MFPFLFRIFLIKN